MALGPVLSSVVKGLFDAIFGRLQRWLEKRRAAHAKARADALADREESKERADQAEEDMDAAAEEARNESNPNATDAEKAEALQDFLGGKKNEDA